MRWILAVSALIALTLAVFALWPGVDLAVAHFFYDRGGFAGRDGLERFGRDFSASRRSSFLPPMSRCTPCAEPASRSSGRRPASA